MSLVNFPKTILSKMEYLGEVVLGGGDSERGGVFIGLPPPCNRATAAQSGSNRAIIPPKVSATSDEARGSSRDGDNGALDRMPAVNMGSQCT